MRRVKTVTTTSVELALQTVRDWAERSGESNEALGQRAGVTEKTVRQAKRPQWNPRARTLAKLLAALPANWQAGDPVPDVAGESAAATGKRAA
jgi:hypothetical protein